MRFWDSQGFFRGVDNVFGDSQGFFWDLALIMG